MRQGLQIAAGAAPLRPTHLSPLLPTLTRAITLRVAEDPSLPPAPASRLAMLKGAARCSAPAG